jgi:hypothetical protein
MSDTPVPGSPDHDVEEIDSYTESGQDSVKRPRFNRDSATAMGPVYTTANEFWQNRLDTMATYTPSSTTEGGQRFTDTLSRIVICTEALQGLPVMIPADTQNNDELIDGDWGATSNFVFALLQEKPTTMTTRVAIVGYLHTPAKVLLHSAEHLVFKTPSNFLTPLGINEMAVRTMMSEPGLEGIAPLSVHRLRTSVSTVVDDTGKSIFPEKAKQSGLYCVMDLNGVLRPCSGKSEGVKRMNKVGGMIRLLGWNRFEKMVLDLDYKPKYFMENCQRYEESAINLPDESHFKSLGKLSHISDLPVFTNKQKLDCILLGTYPQYDRTVICLSDFLRNENKALQWKKEASRQGRTVIIDALRNVEKVFEVFYGAAYKNCLTTVIVALEDESDTFDEYDDLYIIIQFEIILSKFYSDIRYERIPVIFSDMTMETPLQCASLLIHHFQIGLKQAHRTASTGNWENQPHSKFYSSEGTYRKILFSLPSTPPVKKETAVEPTLICPYHIAGQLGILSATGSVIKCTTDKCKYKHERIDKLPRNDVTKCVKTISVKRVRELSMVAIQKFYQK